MKKIELIYGDCLQEMKKIPDNSIDSVITDPPYGTTNCKWDSVINLNKMWIEINRVIKPNSPIVLFASQPFTSALISSNYKMFKQSLVWIKNKSTGHLNVGKRHMMSHEDIVLFSTGQSTYNPQKTKGHKVVKGYKGNNTKSDCYNDSKSSYHKGNTECRHQTSTLKFSVFNNDGSSGVRISPVQKPVELMEYLIKTYTNKHDRVLDFTMGSGTTGIACINLNRLFTGIENDADTWVKANDRINNHILPLSHDSF